MSQYTTWVEMDRRQDHCNCWLLLALVRGSVASLKIEQCSGAQSQSGDNLAALGIQTSDIYFYPRYSKLCVSKRQPTVSFSDNLSLSQRTLFRLSHLATHWYAYFLT
ncbi:hypothetical protein CBL_07943 [Carabus blaptoides fortunei]